MLNNFFNCKAGQAMVQYIILTMILAVSTIGVVKGLRDQVSDNISVIAEQLCGKENSAAKEDGATEARNQASKEYTIAQPNNNVD